ncbi:MAG: hypothetical protein HYU30_04080 [Chloroflexi bacterium]|nr:hypothetical protein [Chloroflexota bacterium]
MKEVRHKARVDVALIAIYLGASLPLQVWSLLNGPVPWLNYGHGWASTPAYGIAAPLVAFLLWRHSPRARLAAYVFLTFDAMRSLRLAHWLPLALDLAIILYLQTPAMRHLYPSMWSRWAALHLPWTRSKEA